MATAAERRIAQRRAFAQSLQQQGSSTAPTTGLGALARALTGGLAGLTNLDVRRQEGALEKEQLGKREEFARALTPDVEVDNEGGFFDEPSKTDQENRLRPLLLALAQSKDPAFFNAAAAGQIGRLGEKTSEEKTAEAIAQAQALAGAGVTELPGTKRELDEGVATRKAVAEAKEKERSKLAEDARDRKEFDRQFGKKTEAQKRKEERAIENAVKLERQKRGLPATKTANEKDLDKVFALQAKVTAGTADEDNIKRLAAWRSRLGLTDDGVFGNALKGRSADFIVKVQSMRDNNVFIDQKTQNNETLARRFLEQETVATTAGGEIISKPGISTDFGNTGVVPPREVQPGTPLPGSATDTSVTEGATTQLPGGARIVRPTRPPTDLRRAELTAESILAETQQVRKLLGSKEQREGLPATGPFGSVQKGLGFLRNPPFNAPGIGNEANRLSSMLTGIATRAGRLIKGNEKSAVDTRKQINDIVTQAIASNDPIRMMEAMDAVDDLMIDTLDTNAVLIQEATQ